MSYTLSPPSCSIIFTAGFQNMVKSLLGHAVPYAVTSRKGRGEVQCNAVSIGSPFYPPCGTVLSNLSWMPWVPQYVLSCQLTSQLIRSSVSEQTAGVRSRIFWCPTAPFVFLPIHAAGLYGTRYPQPGHKVSDFVVSSYIPNLSILSPSPNPNAVPSGDLRLLAVRQPPSDGLSRLKGVNTELDHIRAVIEKSPSAQTTLLESSLRRLRKYFR